MPAKNSGLRFTVCYNHQTMVKCRDYDDAVAAAVSASKRNPGLRVTVWSDRMLAAYTCGKVVG